jgi:predicted DNA-binding WGR domain protein
MNKREFRLTSDTSNKFWAIQLKDSSFTVHFGRVGTAGQSQEKTFPTPEAARREYDKLIKEKTGKGYTEVADGSVAATPTPTPTVRKQKPETNEEPAVATAVEAATASPTAETPAPVTTSATAVAPVSRTAPAAPTAGAAFPLERRVKLRAEDRQRIAWLYHAPTSIPAPRPFDIDACIERVKSTLGSYWLNLDAMGIPAQMTEAEGWFWIQISTEFRKKHRNRDNDIAAWLEAQKTTPPPPLSEMKGWLKWAFANTDFAIFNSGVSALRPFLTPLEIADYIICRLAKSSEENFTKWGRLYTDQRSPSGFYETIVPFLNSDERAELRAGLIRMYEAEPDRASFKVTYTMIFLAMVGGGPELTAYVAGQPDGSWVDPYYSRGNLRVLAGLENEESFVAEAKRLAVPIRDVDDLRLWLAATEWRQLDRAADAVARASAKDLATSMARTLALVSAPEAGGPMLRVQLESKAPGIAVEWFNTHPLEATVGLVPIAMKSGKASEAAMDRLQGLMSDSQSAVLQSAIPYLAPAEAEWLQQQVLNVVTEKLDDLSRAELPAPLQAAFAEIAATKAPAWLNIGSLPPIKLQGKKLGDAEVLILLMALKNATPERQPALFSLLKEHAERNSLDTFAWKLFQTWLSLGAASKDKWALGAVGHLGGDACVLKLTPLVREWPGESQHQRAVYGLECLRMVGTDTALMALNGIAQKLKFKALKEKAQEMMEGIAEARGMTREQLADRIVPDCSLDDRGSRVFDFGPRQFRFVLGAEMKPLIRDASGKVRPDLPPINSADDRAKAEAAVADWKLLKKTLREVLKVQAERLEDAMITGRRWSGEEFETLLVKHPLMINLVRQLVWAVYDPNGQATQSFRVTEDQTYADQNDDAAALPPAGIVGIVHPAHLDDATRGAWGQTLSDYEIIPPFQQLGRPIHRPDPDELEITDITRFRGPKVEGIIMYGMLERSHWSRDTPADGGGFSQHSKYFPAANVTAFIQYSGLSISYYEEPQELESVYFVAGHVEPEMWGHHKNRLKIKDVDTVVLSEVLRLATAIHAKGK